MQKFIIWIGGLQVYNLNKPLAFSSWISGLCRVHHKHFFFITEIVWNGVTSLIRWLCVKVLQDDTNELINSKMSCNLNFFPSKAVMFFFIIISNIIFLLIFFSCHVYFYFWLHFFEQKYLKATYHVKVG